MSHVTIGLSIDIYEILKSFLFVRCQELLHQKDGPRWREKFQLPSVAWWEVPDIIDVDGKSTSQVQFNSPAPPVQQVGSTTQTGSTQRNNDSARKAEEKPRELSAAEKFEKFKAEGNEFVKKVTIQTKYAFKYEFNCQCSTV